MTAELWAIPALLLVVLLIGLVALVRGRPQQAARPPASRLDGHTRPSRPAATRPPPRPFEHSAGGELDTEPENLNSRREAATEALKLARQRAAADAARLEALRQSRARAADQAPVVTPLRRPLPPRRPLPTPAPAEPSRPPLATRPALPDRPTLPDPPAVPDRPAPASAGYIAPPRQQAPAPVAPPVAAPPPPAAVSARQADAGLQPLPPLQPLQPLQQRPLPPPPLPELLPRQAPVPPMAPMAPVVASLPTAPITVLVVDDSKVVRIKTGRLLEKHHYKVMLADDGLTALQAVAEQWPDLVITDVEMPGLDGFGLTRQLRGQPRGGAMPVIMITSSNERHRDEATRAGVSVLLGKPYPEQQLLAEVEKALGRLALPAPAGLLMQ